MCNVKLVVQNLNVQSDASDLFGGFKPLQLRQLALPIYIEFVGRFKQLFNDSANVAYLEALGRTFDGQKWESFANGLKKTIHVAEVQLDALGAACPAATRLAWSDLRRRVASFEVQRKVAAEAFAFSFVEGLLVQVCRAGNCACTVLWWQRFYVPGGAPGLVDLAR